jgi:hypothetical protein
VLRGHSGRQGVGRSWAAASRKAHRGASMRGGRAGWGHKLRRHTRARAHAEEEGREKEVVELHSPASSQRLADGSLAVAGWKP